MLLAKLAKQISPFFKRYWFLKGIKLLPIILLLSIIFVFSFCALSNKQEQKQKQEWKPFVEQWDDNKLGTATDISFLNLAPARLRVWADGQNLIYENGKPAIFLGVNILRTSCFLTKEQAEKTAKRLSKLGCNLVRFARVDATYSKKAPGISRKSVAFDGPVGSLIDTLRDDTQHLDLEALDRFDYFFSKLKEKGVYVWLDLCDLTRNFKKGDKVPLTKNGNAYSDDDFARKQAFFWEERAIELQYKYARLLLEHINPYTKIPFKDEPALAFICLINEAIIKPRRAFLTNETYKKLTGLWNLWLAKHQGELILQPGEKIGEIEVPARWYKNGGRYTDEKRERLFQRFLYQKRKEYISTFKKFLRKLGYKGLIIGTQMDVAGAEIEGANLIIENQQDDSNLQDDSDLIDFHAYINSSIRKRKKKLFFTNAINEPAIKTSKIFCKKNFRKRQYYYIEFFDGNKWGKPCSLSEFAECYPSPWRSESLPLVAYLCKKNGFDVAILFSYNLPRNLFESDYTSTMIPKPPSYTIFFNDPATIGTFRAAAVIMQKVNHDECYWDIDKGFLKIDSPFIQGGTGFFRDQELFQDISIKANGFANIYVISIGHNSISNSKKLFISAVSQAKNTGFIYDQEIGIIENGGPPILINPVYTEIFLLLKEKYKKINLWALNSYGERKEPINGEVINSHDGKSWFKFAIGKQSIATIYYELEKIVDTQHKQKLR